MTHASSSPTEFVLVSTQRSGSAFVASILDALPGASVGPEVFLGLGMHSPENFYRYWAGMIRADERCLAPPRFAEVIDAYLDGFYSRAESASAVGFCLKYDQIPLVPGLLDALERRGVKVVHLVRENVLETLVSSVRSRERVAHGGRAHGDGPQPPERVRLRAQGLCDALAGRIREIGEWRETLSRRFECHELTLERAVCGRSDAGSMNPKPLREVCAFLGIEVGERPPRTTLRSSAARPLAELVDNADEIRAALSGTDYGHLLDPCGTLARPALRPGTDFGQWHAMCASLNRAEAMLAVGRGREAAVLLSGVRRMYPDEPAAAVALGAVYEHTGDLGRSASMYRIALHLDPWDAIAASRLRALTPGSLENASS
ncbi:hypothetical protein GGQ74_002886 [Desulfobaculum xiamenense]|uniref:Sulfotransferase family protein n=1 Tax=Desulfobaculum xiamenense TaxID=995050 RepID=A0A846QX43_9BACT|nr:tetratricopeptide repeat protein [Desulfobaculum xiamenense]NJB69189.1 hypothetical protein [Desulfobaculum xiamenense]